MSKERRKGTGFETACASWLNERLETDQFHRLAMGGANDRGDVWGLTSHGRPVVIECKNVRGYRVSEWLGECEVERGNADALAGVVIAKRPGIGERRMGEQLVLMTLEDLVAIVTGDREER